MLDCLQLLVTEFNIQIEGNTMNYSVDGTTISIEVSEILSSMPKEQLVSIIQSLSCMGEVINHVMDQVLDGYTIDGYCGSAGLLTSKYLTPLEEARVRVAMQADSTAAKTIEELREAVLMLNDRIDILNQQARSPF
jgi:hypothetical protein